MKNSEAKHDMVCRDLNGEKVVLHNRVGPCSWEVGRWNEIEESYDFDGSVVNVVELEFTGEFDTDNSMLSPAPWFKDHM